MLSMKVGHRIGKQPGPPALPRSVAALLRRKGAAIHLPGADGEIVSGFHTGNYTDSVGSIPATIDGKTGLVVDAAGSVGAELASVANWVPSAGTTVSGGIATSTSVVGGNNIVAQDGIGTASKMILVTATINVVSGGVQFRPGGVSGPTISTSGTYTHRIQSGAVDAFRIIAGASGFTGSIDLSTVSVRELTGIHATQATDGFKPVERRGLVNLLTYSNDFSNAVWNSKANVTISGNKIIETNDSATTFHSVGRAGATVGVAQTFCAVISPLSRSSVAIQLGSNAAYFNVQDGSVISAGALAATIAPVGGGAFICAVSGVVATNGNTLILPAVGGSAGYIGNGSESLACLGTALFQGTVTAQQIIDAGGIPVTTTEPKSSSLGPRYLQFEDARATRMLLSKQPFDFMGDWCVVFAASCDRNDSVVDAVFANCYSVNNDGMYLGFFQGKPILSLKTGAVTSLLQPTALAVDTPVVVSARKIGNTVQLRVNSVLVGETTKVWTTPTAPDTFSIGSIGSSYFLNGKLHALGYSGGTYSDTELLLLEKFAGKLAGVQI